MGKYVGSSLFVGSKCVDCSKCTTLYLRLSSDMHDMVHGICEVCHKGPSIKASCHKYIKDMVLL